MSFFFGAAALHRHAVTASRAGMVCMLCAGPGAGMNAIAADSVDARRARMVDEVAQMARDTARETGRGTFDARVMAALGKVERHRFMPPHSTAPTPHSNALSRRF